MMWVRSYISHFKKIVLFVVVVIVIIRVMNYLYVDDTNEFARCMMHEFYEGEKNIDRLYLGSSHVFCDINPAVLDDINGENNFNMATSMQQLITSYYLLKEADQKYQIDKVYLDLAYYCTNEGPGNLHDYLWIPYSWIALNQMKPSVNKLAYMLDLSSFEYYYMTFLPFMRYKEKFFDFDYVSGIVEGKQADEWKNYEYSYITPDGKSVSKRDSKGFIIHYGTLEHGNFYVRNEERAIKENPMTQESKEYLLRIVEYCKKHDIELIWISCPVSDFELVHKGGYDNYVREVTKLAEQYQIPYYDFNLCRREYLDVSQEKYWSDMGHMNMYGAEVFSEFLGEFLLAEEKGESIYQGSFYSSYEEKIGALKEVIYGLEVVQSQDYERCIPDVPAEQWEEYVIYRLRPVTNALEGNIDINVSVVEDAGTGERVDVPVIRDGNDGYVIFTMHEHGHMCVEAKLDDSEEVTNWTEIKY